MIFDENIMEEPMKLEEEFVGKSNDFAQLLRTIADQLESNELTVRNQPVTFPELVMEYKIKLKKDLGQYKFTIAIEWLE